MGGAGEGSTGVGGMRRGGRRVSKRMSELLGIFEPEGGAGESQKNNSEYDCAENIPESDILSFDSRGQYLKSNNGGFTRDIVTGSTANNCQSWNKEFLFEIYYKAMFA